MCFELLAAHIKHLLEAISQFEITHISDRAESVPILGLFERDFTRDEVFIHDLALLDLRNIQCFELPAADGQLDKSLRPDLELGVGAPLPVVFVGDDIGETQVGIERQVEGRSLDRGEHHAHRLALLQCLVVGDECREVAYEAVFLGSQDARQIILGAFAGNLTVEQRQSRCLLFHNIYCF